MICCVVLSQDSYLDEHNNPVVAKTGMGSSAAMTTSLVASLLEFFQVINLENGSHRDLEILHNLAQLAHAIAQGKIGSGFDVSSAVYGTQVYERFDPSILNACLPSDVSSRTIYETVMNQSAWNQVIHPFSLPPGLDLMMGDVCGGSSSTSMVNYDSESLFSYSHYLFINLRPKLSCNGEVVEKMVSMIIGIDWVRRILLLLRLFTI